MKKDLRVKAKVKRNEKRNKNFEAFRGTFLLSTNLLFLKSASIFIQECFSLFVKGQPGQSSSRVGVLFHSIWERSPNIVLSMTNTVLWPGNTKYYNEKNMNIVLMIRHIYDILFIVHYNISYVSYHSPMGLPTIDIISSYFSQL